MAGLGALLNQIDVGLIVLEVSVVLPKQTKIYPPLTRNFRWKYFVMWNKKREKYEKAYSGRHYS